MLWKGNVAYQVCNPEKPVKFGVEIYMVCVFIRVCYRLADLHCQLQPCEGLGTLNMELPAASEYRDVNADTPVCDGIFCMPL